MSTQLDRHEPHSQRSVSNLNSLRAAVLGANDGIVSVAGIVLGVAGASNSSTLILTSGIAGLAAGALSMAAGEFVSVSSQRDTEKVLLNKERSQLRDYPVQELADLQALYEAKGLTQKTAKLVADELTANDVFAAHADVGLGINPDNLTNPWQAALASMLSFLVGALIPLCAILIAPLRLRILVTFASVIIALCLTGLLSARVSGANKLKATARVVIGGALAMAITYSVGHLVGHHLN